jgi:predicted ATP-grasp superfamily ATP-dependent carboligase
MRIAVDKTATLARAATLGIRIPAGDVIRSREDALRAAEEFPFPAVLKVAGLIRGTLPPEWEFKYRYFENRDEWAAFIRGAPDCPQEYLLQEFIPGRYTGIGIAMQAGRAVAAFQWLALREYEAGLGGLRISQPLDPTLFDQAQRLCADIGYEGVCEVEFRGADPPALMEINPRLWGGASFPVACGVDFPFIAYQIYSGIPVEPRFEYRAGLLGRNLPGDLKWFLKGFLLGSYKQAIPSIRVSRGRVLRDFVSSLGKARVHDLESWDDPMPAVGHYVRKLTRLRLPTK